MKFYIGSGLKNCELVNYYSKILELNGWRHTYNWAKNINNNIVRLVGTADENLREILK